MILKKTILILSLSFYLSCSSSTKNISSIDVNLIVPGKTAEGYNIGDRIEDNELIQYDNEKKSIGDILEIEAFKYLTFDSIIYKDDSSVIFIKDGVINAIAGLKIERRVTSDAVLLSRGIDNFILNYGNKGLLTSSSGNHKVYYYKELGIAVFNDDSDGSINMYLIFNK